MYKGSVYIVQARQGRTFAVRLISLVSIVLHRYISTMDVSPEVSML